MPFCIKCGREVTQGIKFCPNCGNSMPIAPTTQPAPMASAPQPYQQPQTKYWYQKRSGQIGIVVVIILIIIGAAVAASRLPPTSIQPSPYATVKYSTLNWVTYNDYSKGNVTLLVLNITITNHGYDSLDLHFLTLKVQANGIVYDESYLGGGTVVQLSNGTDAYLDTCTTSPYCTYSNNLGYGSRFPNGGLDGIKMLNGVSVRGYESFELPANSDGTSFTLTISCSFACTPDNSQIATSTT